MSDNVKIALIIAAALLLSVCLYLYFSPYQTCVRAGVSGGSGRDVAEVACAIRRN